jgi:hypothetical protein
MQKVTNLRSEEIGAFFPNNLRCHPSTPEDAWLSTHPHPRRSLTVRLRSGRADWFEEEIIGVVHFHIEGKMRRDRL